MEVLGDFDGLDGEHVEVEGVDGPRGETDGEKGPVSEGQSGEEGKGVWRGFWGLPFRALLACCFIGGYDPVFPDKKVVP